MNILLILNDSNMHERLGVMHLSSALKAQNNHVKLVVAAKYTREGLNALVVQFAPEIIGYSAMTGEHIGIHEVNKQLKKVHKFIAVLGGPHATFFPEVIDDGEWDAICVGEGDIAFPEFCRRVECGEEYWLSPSMIVKHGGEIYKNPLLTLVEDLDMLPFPDRGIMYEADPVILESSQKYFFSTRGCPYKCTYCFNSKQNELFKGKGAILRNRSPESMISEVLEVKQNYPLQVVHFEDDTFLLKSKEWFEEFISLYKEKIALPLFCNVRANVVTEENVAILRDAGLMGVCIGIECGNEKISNELLQRNITNKQLLDACAILKKYDIKIIAQNLVGMPVPGSYSVDLETLDLNLKIKPTFAWSSILTPYPGTPIEKLLREQGIVGDETLLLETNKRSSVFDFSSPLEKRRIENLHKLFGLIVEYPFLRRFTDQLVSLPLNRLYSALFYLFYGYNYKVRFFPLRSLRKEILSYMKFWWRMVHKS